MTVSCSRRRALRAGAAFALVGVAGCNRSGRSTTGSTSESPTDSGKRTLSSGESRRFSDKYEVTVSEPAVRKLVASSSPSSNHVDVVGFPDKQFLTVEIAIEGEDEADVPQPDELDVSVILDGESVEATSYVVGAAWHQSQSKRLAIPVTVQSVDEVALEVSAADEECRWMLDDVVADLAVQPVFDVIEVTVPESVESGAPIEVSLTVANRGDRSGRFLFEIQMLLSDGSEYEFEIDAEETVSRSFDVDPQISDDQDEVPVSVQWGLDNRLQYVVVESS